MFKFLSHHFEVNDYSGEEARFALQIQFPTLGKKHLSKIIAQTGVKS